MAHYSRADRELIEGFIDALHELVIGDRRPATPQRTRFVEVVRNGLPPEDDYQRAYLNWCMDNPTVFAKMMGRPAKVRRRPRVAVKSDWEKEKDERHARLAKHRREEARNEVKKRAAGIYDEPLVAQRQPEKPYARKASEPWGTREAWAKDRGSWRR